MLDVVIGIAIITGVACATIALACCKVSGECSRIEEEMYGETVYGEITED